MVNENLIAARLVQKPIHLQPLALVSFTTRITCEAARTLIHVCLRKLIGAREHHPAALRLANRTRVNVFHTDRPDSGG
jgi:hypothetical protein